MPDEYKIAEFAWREYGIKVTQITYLPISADRDTSLYCLSGVNGARYFLKLRPGRFNEAMAYLPKFLADQGSKHIIVPLTTINSCFWASLADQAGMIYPYYEVVNGYQVDLTNRQWIKLGETLWNIHLTILPDWLAKGLRLEAYSPYWRDKTRSRLEGLEDESRSDPVSIELFEFVYGHREGIFDLLARAERLARTIRYQDTDPVLCHSDLHAGNILVNSNGEILLIDWDDPLIAPRERDLMFIGGGLMGNWRPPREEEALFYQGYGDYARNPVAISYFRYARIIEDLAIFWNEIVSGTDKLEDRRLALTYFRSNFLAGGPIEIAYRTEPNEKS